MWIIYETLSLKSGKIISKLMIFYQYGVKIIGLS